MLKTWSIYKNHLPGRGRDVPENQKFLAPITIIIFKNSDEEKKYVLQENKKIVFQVVPESNGNSIKGFDPENLKDFTDLPLKSQEQKINVTTEEHTLIEQVISKQLDSLDYTQEVIDKNDKLQNVRSQCPNTTTIMKGWRHFYNLRFSKQFNPATCSIWSCPAPEPTTVSPTIETPLDAFNAVSLPKSDSSSFYGQCETTTSESRLFLGLDINGKKIIGLLDDGSIYSYLGKGLGKYFDGKYPSLEPKVNVANGSSVNIEGLLDVTVNIGGCEETITFRIADGLECDCILGIDFKRLFKLKIDYENNTWWTPKGKVHYFEPYGYSSVYFPGVVTLSESTRSSELLSLNSELLEYQIDTPTLSIRDSISDCASNSSASSTPIPTSGSNQRSSSVLTLNSPTMDLKQCNTLSSREYQIFVGRQRPGCWNCGKKRHNWRQCYEPRTIFCRRCGKKNVTSKECVNCQEQYLSTVANHNC